MSNPSNPSQNVRRQQILDAAIPLFAEKGIHKTSMNDIVAASGVSKGGLYWHFKSKDDVIATVLKQFFTREIEAFTQLMKAEMPASSKLQLMVQGITAELQSSADLLSISLEFFALAARQEKIRLFIREYYRTFSVLLAQVLQQGFDAGEFQSTIPIPQLATNLMAQFDGVMLMWAIDSDAFDLAQQMEVSINLYLVGLKNNE